MCARLQRLLPLLLPLCLYLARIRGLLCHLGCPTAQRPSYLFTRLSPCVLPQLLSARHRPHSEFVVGEARAWGQTRVQSRPSHYPLPPKLIDIGIAGEQQEPPLPLHSRFVASRSLSSTALMRRRKSAFARSYFELLFVERLCPATAARCHDCSLPCAVSCPPTSLCTGAQDST